MAESDPVCTERGIPDYLHTLNRQPDSDFMVDERLFIRFRVEERKMKTILGFRRQSSNRSKYCDAGAEDALFNSERGGRYEGCGVVEIAVARLREINVAHPNDQAKRYTVLPDHKPTQCNFAHTEIVAHENGMAVEDITPK